MIAGCTIVSPNYLHFARTLSSSYLQHHPGHKFFVLIVADLQDSAPFMGSNFTPVMLNEIGIPDLRSEAMKYELLELNTNVKPSFLKYLLRNYELDEVIYLDPDIFVYSPLDPVFEALEEADIVLTPHMTAPVFDGKIPGERDMLYNGTFNLGFIALRAADETSQMLDWWEMRCLELGYSEGRAGLFVDQKWMNLVPGFFSNVHFLRDPGCNMAFWNLHERHLEKNSCCYRVNGSHKLRFFHFSGIRLEDPESLSQNTDRFTLKTRPDLREIFDPYKQAVLANRRLELDSLPYGFDRFSDGTAVTRLARRIFGSQAHRWAGEDPFDAEGSFAHFARRNGLVRDRVRPAKVTWHEFDGADWRVRAVHAALLAVLRAVGPNRYELLMRYLGHITILRNQSVLFK